MSTFEDSSRAAGVQRVRAFVDWLSRAVPSNGKIVLRCLHKFSFWVETNRLADLRKRTYFHIQIVDVYLVVPVLFVTYFYLHKKVHTSTVHIFL